MDLKKGFVYAKNVDDLILKQLELFYNSKFTNYNSPSKGYYEDWQKLTKENKYPEFKFIISDWKKIIFIPNPSLEVQLEAVGRQLNLLTILV